MKEGKYLFISPLILLILNYFIKSPEISIFLLSLISVIVFLSYGLFDFLIFASFSGILIILNHLPYFHTILLHLALFLFATPYISREQFSFNFKSIILLVISCVLVSLSTAFIFMNLGLPMNENVYLTISKLPLYILIFAIVFVPLSEEFFFRGFLSKKLGIIISSILFALSHFSYYSIYEVVVAFFVGLIFAYNFKKENSLLNLIIAHFLINLISISVVYII